jgi:hypothetical protein
VSAVTIDMSCRMSCRSLTPIVQAIPMVTGCHGTRPTTRGRLLDGTQIGPTRSLLDGCSRLAESAHQSERRYPDCRAVGGASAARWAAMPRSAEALP